MNKLENLLAEREWLLLDGGIGTGLFVRGLTTGDSPELWNIDYPDRILDLHLKFIEAGSDIILTNSFGGNRYRLKLHDLTPRMAELNIAAARIAKEAAKTAEREVLVAGSIGPTGEILEPVGSLSEADATAAFAEQAQALAEGGADLIWCETLSSAEELRAAAKGAATAGLPVIATMSFDTNGRTMMGLTPEGALAIAHDLPLSGFGANCGTGAAQLTATVKGLAAAAKADDYIIAKANCGIPEYVDGRIHYSGTPELMADYACLVRDLGARLIGGCCGTMAAHLKAMRQALENTPKASPPSDSTIESRLGPITLPKEVSKTKTRERSSRRRRS